MSDEEITLPDYPPGAKSTGLLNRIAELEAALREIVAQADIARDPRHMTLGLVKHIAKQALGT